MRAHRCTLFYDLKIMNDLDIQILDIMIPATDPV